MFNRPRWSNKEIEKQEAAQVDTEPVPPPAPPPGPKIAAAQAQEPRAGRDALLAQIREGKTLRKTPKKSSRVTDANQNDDNRDILDYIKDGFIQRGLREQVEGNDDDADNDETPDNDWETD